MRLSVDNNKNYDIVMRMIKWLFNLLHSIDFNRGGFVPCSHQLPTLRSVSSPDEDKTQNLPTCFPIYCACRKTERQGYCYSKYVCICISFKG